MPANHVLAEILSTQGATDLHRHLTGLNGAPVEIDCGQVRHLSAQAAQVLLAAMKSWHSNGAEFRLRNFSGDMRRCVELLGLHEQLQEATS